jgi:hypothetical protein
MTEQELAELRQWTAFAVMGWSYLDDIDMSNFGTQWQHNFSYDNPGFLHQNGAFIHEKIWNDSLCYFQGDKKILNKINWRPDDPTTGQIWMVVDRMMKLSYSLRLFSPHYALPWAAHFNNGGSLKDFIGHDDSNPCIAILLAARKALGAVQDDSGEGKP